MARGESAVLWMFGKKALMMTLGENLKLFLQTPNTLNPSVLTNYNSQEKENIVCNEGLVTMIGPFIAFPNKRPNAAHITVCQKSGLLY